jgi:uncharacterized protein involved in outer membrane biogenesis
MKHTRILLIVLAVVILLPVTAVAVFVATFDADSAKPRIVAAVEAATGRRLVIAGPIRLAPSLHPSIQLTDVTLSNPDGFSRPQMAVLQRLDLKLALLPLLSRRIEIDSLAIHGADILLEMNAGGVGNWRFNPAPAAPQQPATTASTTTASPPPSIHVEAIEVDDGQIAYRNARMATPVVLAVSTLTLRGGKGDEPIDLSLAATADTTPLALSGRVGPPSVLLGNTASPLTLDLKLVSAGATILAAGTIADATHLSGTDLRISADIPDLGALSALTRNPLPPLKGLVGKTRLTDLAGRPGILAGFMLHELQLALPQAQLDGEISLTRGSPPLFQGTLHASRIDADGLRAASKLPKPEVQAVAATSPPVPAAAAPVASPAAPARLIPDREIRFDALHAANADLNVTIGELVQGGVTYRDLAGHVVLTNAALRLDPFTATVPGGVVRFSLAVDAGQTEPPVALTLSAPSVELAPLLAALRLPPYAQGNARLDADLHGAGRSPHQIAASLDGSVGLSMETAQIDTRILGDALNSVEMLRTGKTGFTQLRCLAARMDVQDGAGTMRALLLDAVPVRLSGTGGLNLGDETLALRMQTTVRMGATGIGAPLNVGGTFLAPKVKLDAAVPGGGKANNPFGLVIGKLDQLIPSNTGDSCVRDLAIARGETPPAQEPASQPKPADLLRQLLR